MNAGRLQFVRLLDNFQSAKVSVRARLKFANALSGEAMAVTTAPINQLVSTA